MHHFIRIKNSLKLYGIKGCVQNVLSILEDFIFNLRYGIDTREAYPVRDYESLNCEETYPYRYQPTRLRHFRFLMEQLHLPHRGVFLDIGSGKGKMLLIAARYSFQKIMGVEISEELCQIAMKNVSRYQKKTGKSDYIQIIQSDILHYPIPGDVNIFYLFNPFKSSMMKIILKNIERSLKEHPRKVWIVFNNFKYHELFENNDLFRKILIFKYGGAEFIVYQSK